MPGKDVAEACNNQWDAYCSYYCNGLLSGAATAHVHHNYRVVYGRLLAIFC